MGDRSLPAFGAALLALALAIGAAPARAQEGGAAAESLFDEGRALLAQGKYPEACAKFAASERLDPAVGTLLNLGDCYEKTGKIATAWAIFKQASTMARAGKQPARERIADGRVASLEPRIPKLSVAVSAPTPGLEVSRDGVAMSPAEWSAGAPSALAVDPGEHVLSAVAPGKKPWSTKVTLAADGQTTHVDVPALEVDELAERAPLDPRREMAAVSVEAVTTHDRDVQRALGIAVGGLGALAMITAVPVGLHAITLNKDAKTECPTNTTCTSDGQSDASSAVVSGTASTVLLVGGGAILGAGVVLFLTAPQPKHEAPRGGVRMRPFVGIGAAGLEGSF